MPVKKEEPLSVCIIGAGVSGVLAIKACLEEGFQVTCFEKSDAFGGLWQYRAGLKDDFVASVMKTTVLNTSKELSAFSDYPPPDNYPNFMPHHMFMDYMTNYVDHFKLREHIKLNHTVIRCTPIRANRCCRSGSFHHPSTNSNGVDKSHLSKEIRLAGANRRQLRIGWQVDVRNDANESDDVRKKERRSEEKERDGREEEEEEERSEIYTFDRLIVAIGHHALPHRPHFPGQEIFKGEIMHTHELKDPIHEERFQEKRVCVVGIGNSACDAAVDISLVSKICYLSSHRGNWFLARLGPSGPYDVEWKTRWSAYLQSSPLSSLINAKLRRTLDQRWPHHLLGFEAQHEPTEHPPNINDYMAQRVISGAIELRQQISRFTERGLFFKGDQKETQLDLVVLGTGYKVKLPFFADEYHLGLRSRQTDELCLYLNIYAPQIRLESLKEPSLSEQDIQSRHQELEINDPQNKEEEEERELIESLAFVGFVQPGGSIFVCSEMQSRHVVQVFAGKLHLPKDKRDMFNHVEERRAAKSSGIRSQSREFDVQNWTGYLDELAEQVGAKPNMFELFINDFKLWRQLMFGPSVPYQYRLKGPHSCSKAREYILTVPDRIMSGINGGQNHLLYKYRQRRLLANASPQSNCLSSSTTEEQLGDSLSTRGRLHRLTCFVLWSLMRMGQISQYYDHHSILSPPSSPRITPVINHDTNTSKEEEEAEDGDEHKKIHLHNKQTINGQCKPFHQGKDRYSVVAPSITVSLVASTSVAVSLWMLLNGV